jgi:hypothetical protein
MKKSERRKGGGKRERKYINLILLNKHETALHGSTAMCEVKFYVNFYFFFRKKAKLEKKSYLERNENDRGINFI